MELETFEDLENLIENQIEESLNLDYKAAGALAKSDGKKKEIGKDVSSFANSDGGIIIYGMKEFSEDEYKHLPESIDPVDRSEFSKEWLEQTIHGNISPRIPNLTITSISGRNANDVIFVVKIEKSTTAHQASDMKYYKRYNFLSTAMHDYEIRDIMNRNKSPKIQIKFELEQNTYEVKSNVPQFAFEGLQNPAREYRTTNKLSVYAFNEGGVYANYVNCFLEIPVSLLHEDQYDNIDSYEKNGELYKQIYCENTIREVKEVTTIMNNVYPKYWPSRYDPILPNTRLRLDEIHFRNNIEITSGTIIWKVNADNAEVLHGTIEVPQIEKQIKV